MSTTPNHYATLGVARDSSPEEIKEAWRKVARQTHPDRGGDQDSFARASLAYQTIGYAPARLKYNMQLDLENDVCSVCDRQGRVYRQLGFTGRVGKLCETCKGSGVLARSRS